MEVIRLRTPKGHYLRADEDRVSVALSKPCSNVPLPKNTEWKVEWLEDGKCCLKSMYEKVLAVGNCLFIIQESCPVSDGAGDWLLQNMNIDDNEFQAKLKHVNDSRYLETTDNGVCLGSTDRGYVRSKLWTVEVVKGNNNSEQKMNSEQHLLQRTISERDLLVKQWLQEQEQKQKQQQLQQKWKQDQQRQQQYFVAGPPMCGYDKLGTPRLMPYTSACISQSNWPVQQLDHAEQLLNCEQELQKSNSTNYSNTPPPLPSTTTTTTITASKEVAPLPPTTTITTITASKEAAVVTTPISHHQLVQLSGCQVAQVVLTCFNPGVGGGYSHFYSGHNVNGSGTQTNGDVNVHTAVGNTIDIS